MGSFCEAEGEGGEVVVAAVGGAAVADETGEVGGVGFVGASGFVDDAVRSLKKKREVGRHCGRSF